MNESPADYRGFFMVAIFVLTRFQKMLIHKYWLNLPIKIKKHIKRETLINLTFKDVFNLKNRKTRKRETRENYKTKQNQ